MKLDQLFAIANESERIGRDTERERVLELASIYLAKGTQYSNGWPEYIVWWDNVEEFLDAVQSGEEAPK